MKNKVLLPVAACAALPILWAVLPSSELHSTPNPGAAIPAEPAAHAAAEAAGTDWAGALTSVAEVDSAGPQDMGSRTPVAVEASGPDRTAKAAIPELPKVLKLSEVGPAIGARLNSRLALFDEPTDEMYAAWYAGSDLEDLARVSFDTALATNAFAVLEWSGQGRMSAAADYGLGQLAEHRTSFQKETAWLDAEVSRHIELRGKTSAIALASKSDDELRLAFPGPSDRHVLRSRLLQEYNALTREAGRDEFAKIREMSPKERTKYTTPMML